MLPDHEALPGAVEQVPALAPYGFTDQRQLTADARPEIEDGGVELDEFDVAEPRAGAQRDGHPVAGGDRRIGGHRVHLADAARGQDDGPGAHGTHTAAGALAEHVQRDPATAGPSPAWLTAGSRSSTTA